MCNGVLECLFTCMQMRVVVNRWVYSYKRKCHSAAGIWLWTQWRTNNL